MKIIDYQLKRLQFDSRKSVQYSALVSQIADKGDNMLFFQLLANYPQDLIAVLQVQCTVNGAEMSGDCRNYPVFVLQGTDVCFEDADHVF